jgi:hypothetical protein
MPKTYEPIATQTLVSSSSTITFSSIPSTYTDLILVINGQGSVRVDANVRVGNGSVDTGTNYSRTGLSGNGTAASSYRVASETSWVVDSVADSGGCLATLQIMNYANTTTNKSALARIAATISYSRAVAYLWRSTAAINIITITAPSSTYLAGSVFTLYGIKAA